MLFSIQCSVEEVRRELEFSVSQKKFRGSIVQRLKLRRIRFDCQAVGTSGSIVKRFEIRYGKEKDNDLGDQSILGRENDETNDKPTLYVWIINCVNSR